MKVKHFSTLCLLLMISLMACQDDDTVETNKSPGDQLSDPDDIETFFENLNGQPLRMSRLYLEDSALVDKCMFSNDSTLCDSVYFRFKTKSP